MNLNERRTRRGVYLVLPEQQDDSEESEEEAEQSSLTQESSATSESPPSDVPKTPTKAANAIIDLTTSSPTSISAPRRGLIARMRPSLATMKREAAERSNCDIPKSIITTRGQKAREASLASTPSQQSASPFPAGPLSLGGNQLVTPSPSVASTPNLRSRTRNASSTVIEKAASTGSARTAPSLSQNGPKRRGRPPKNADAVVVKVEEKDESDKLHDRSLRARRSVPVLTTGKASGGGKDKASLVPEKPTPTGPCCMTCSNPLPSLELPSPQRKGKSKEIKEDCARWVSYFQTLLIVFT